MNGEYFNWTACFKVLLIGYGLIAAQGVEAWLDGRLTKAQVIRNGYKSYAISQHGGVAVADIFIITPMFAFFAGLYRYDFSSWRAVLSFAVIALVTRVLMHGWQEQGKLMGDHATHDGVTMPAGWEHGLYFMLFVWFAVQAFLGLTTPVFSTRDLLILTIGLTFFWPLGVMKFDWRWRWDSGSVIQVGGGVLATWIICIVRILWHR